MSNENGAAQNAAWATIQYVHRSLICSRIAIIDEIELAASLAKLAKLVNLIKTEWLCYYRCRSSLNLSN